MLGGGVEEYADLEAGVGQVVNRTPQDVRGARGGWGEPDDDAQRGGLPGAVGAEEAGDAARLGGEGDVVDRGEGAVRLGDGLDGDHRASTTSAVMGEGLKPFTIR